MKLIAYLAVMIQYALVFGHIAPPQEVLTKAFKNLPERVFNTITRDKIIDHLSEKTLELVLVVNITLTPLVGVVVGKTN